MVVVRTVQQKKGGAKVLAAVQAGGFEGRQALDSYVKPPSGKVGANRMLELLERFSWMAVIGDHEDLEREAAEIEGHINIVSQLQAQAAVGLLAHRTEPRDLERLRGVADRIEAEGGALSKLVKKQSRDLATVASALQQQPLDPDAMQRVYAKARQSGVATKVVLMRFLARAAEAGGQDPRRFQAEADDAMAKLAA
jgi:hypothetical protein